MDKPSENPAGPERYHALDALRAFALLLGVVYHAAESFMAGHLQWAIVDSSPSLTLRIFRHASHSFRMEIFFLIAGFFARLLYHRRGVKEFWRNRLSRILVPFVVGWVVLYPLLVFIWIWGAGVSDNWTRIDIPVEFRDLPPWKLTLAFFATLQFIPMFDLTHLWFLHQLLVIYVLALGGRALLVRWQLFGTRILPRADRLLAACLSSFGPSLLLPLVTAPILLSMDGWTVDTPQRSLLPYWPTTLLYGFFFVCGWLLHRQPGLLDKIARHWPMHLLTGLLLVFPTAYPRTLAAMAGWGSEAIVMIRLMHAFIYAWMMWAFVLGFTGLFLRYRARRSVAWRYVADSSYWVYLAHLPVIAALQVCLGRAPLHWTVKFPIILAIATPVLFLSYHYLVRPTFIGRQLNGRRYPRTPIGPGLLALLNRPRPNP